MKLLKSEYIFTISWPLFIFLSALFVRFLLFSFDDGVVPAAGDSPQYLTIAESLRGGNGFSLNGHDPTASRMPLYPLFLAGILSLPHASVRTVQIFQIILNCITCVIMYFLATRLLDRRHGVLCGMLTALYIPMASQCLFILTETLFTFLFVISLYILSEKHARTGILSASGVVIGFASLVRPIGLIIAIFLMVWLVYVFGWRKSLPRLTAFSFCLGLILMPWIVRNAYVFHRLIPTYTSSGLALYNSYIIPEEGSGYNEIKPEHSALFFGKNEADKSSYLTQITLRYIKNHPWLALKLIPSKLALLVYPFDIKWIYPGFPFRYNIFWGVIFMLAILSLLHCASFVTEKLSLVIFSLGALLFTSIVYYGSPRLRSPYDPFIILLSSVGALWVWKQKRKWLRIAGIAGMNALLLVAGDSLAVIEIIRRLKPW